MRGLCTWKMPLCGLRGVQARENYGEDHVSSMIAPSYGEWVHHLQGPSPQLGNEGQGCELPGVCPDVDVGNCQHWSDSTSEISSFHLKSELGRLGAYSVWVSGRGYVESETISGFQSWLSCLMTLSVSLLSLNQNHFLPSSEKRSWDCKI